MCGQRRLYLECLVVRNAAQEFCIVDDSLLWPPCTAVITSFGSKYAKHIWCDGR